VAEKPNQSMEENFNLHFRQRQKSPTKKTSSLQKIVCLREVQGKMEKAKFTVLQIQRTAFFISTQKFPKQTILPPIRCRSL
jgi:hypothetical protein